MKFNVFKDFPPDEPVFKFDPLLQHPNNPTWGEFCRLGQAAMDVMDGSQGHKYDEAERKVLAAGFRMGFLAGFRVCLEQDS